MIFIFPITSQIYHGYLLFLKPRFKHSLTLVGASWVSYGKDSEAERRDH